MPFDESTTPDADGQQQPVDAAPLHEAVPVELPPHIAESEGAMAHEAHGYSVATPRPGEITEVLDETGTKKIPVRIMEDSSYSYTDADGKQLATGHDISPGTEERWGLGLESGGKLVEHNASRARDMADATIDTRKHAQEWGVEPGSLGEEIYEAHIKNEEEEAGIEYDLKHGIPLSEEQFKKREEELLDLLEGLPKLMREAIENLRRLRENQFGQSKSASVSGVELNNAAQERSRDLVDEEGREDRP